MSNTVLKPNQFKSDQMKFTNKIKNKNVDGESSYINYGPYKGYVRVQTPWMMAPYGASVSNQKQVDMEGKAKKFSLELSFLGMEDNEKIKQLKEMLDNFDNRVFEVAKESKWMGKCDDPVLDSKHRKSVKFSFDDDGEPKPYPPTFRMNIPKNYSTGNFETKFYTKSGEQLNDVTENNISDIINKGSKVRAIAECKGVYFTGREKFGTSWRLLQVQVEPNQKELKECAFTPDSDEEDEGETQNKNENEMEETSNSSYEEVNDTESEKVEANDLLKEL